MNNEILLFQDDGSQEIRGFKLQKLVSALNSGEIAKMVLRYDDQALILSHFIGNEEEETGA